MPQKRTSYITRHAIGDADSPFSQLVARTTVQAALGTLENQETWLEDLGQVGQALKTWRESLIQDMGGKANVSAMQRAIIELAAKTYLMLASVDAFLLEQPSLVNKRRRLRSLVQPTMELTKGYLFHGVDLSRPL